MLLSNILFVLNLMCGDKSTLERESPIITQEMRVRGGLLCGLPWWSGLPFVD